MKQYRFLFIFILWSGVVSALVGRELPPEYVNFIGHGRIRKPARVASDCLPATASTNLDVNNVRCLIHNGGDMWWDLVSNPRYEIPKGSGLHSMFAGAIWIGGIDASGQLRVAAQTYRQSGNDYFPGPLRNDGTASTEQSICEKWDRMYVIYKSQIDEFLADYATGQVDYSKYPVIKEWPAVNSDPGFDRYLAPFVDVDGDGEYNPDNGDYPKIIGDQAIWWVYNDKGNIHSETGGNPIGIEIQAMAFAFSTTNEVNNMTFYNYKIINRSTFTLNQTFMGQWVDPDLGYYADDYVGSDCDRGLGFCYNGDAVDDPANGGYGSYPPAIGVDFFQGPLADTADGVDNDKDGLVDEVNPPNGVDDDGDGLIDEPDELYERWAMHYFFYYNNDFSVVGNPSQPQHFYGYLSGKWKDGSPIVDDGGDGYPDPGSSFPPAECMFYGYPGNVAKCPFTNTSGWNEASAGNQPFDRRFVQSAGPFTLQPGAVNTVTIGVVWARDFGNLDSDQFGSVCALLAADDVAQALFDANFQLLQGPDAPNLSIIELDRELILTWDYEATKNVSNNAYENYAQADPVLVAKGVPDPVFEFEGYLIYQLRDKSVSAADLDNPDLARLIAQCDIKNDVSTIVNRTVLNVGGQEVIQDEIMVQGENKGLFHSLRVTKDAFTLGGEDRLINYQTYYFAVVAYAYNDTSADGRKFIRGNGNFRVVAAMPHPEGIEFNGLVLNSQYGEGVEITRIQGVGSSDQFVRLKPSSENQILANTIYSTVTYQKNYGPISVKVVDPAQVKGSTYRVVLVRDQLYKLEELPNQDSAKYLVDWVLLEQNGVNYDTIYRSIYMMLKRYNAILGTYGSYQYVGKRPFDGTEQIIPGHGISISVKNVPYPGDLSTVHDGNGFVGAEITYADSSKRWLVPYSDVDGGFFDWIVSGTGDNDANSSSDSLNNRIDPDQVYEDILGGLVAPYCLAAPFNTSSSNPRIGVLWGNSENLKTIAYNKAITLKKLPNVDLVITPDPSKWSYCLVLESTPDPKLGSGSWFMAAKWRKSRNVLNGNQVDYINIQNNNLTRATQGRGIFPGYAIDVNTGRRLNILFTEATWFKNYNGDDMLWNPTPYSPFNSADIEAASGRHFIIITNTTYDSCKFYEPYLLDSTIQFTDPQQIAGNVGGNLWDLRPAINTYAWVLFPGVDSRFAFKEYKDIPTETRISLRVNRPYEITTDSSGNSVYPIFEFSTNDLVPSKGVTEVVKNILKNEVRVVPNPFYGKSGIGLGRFEQVAQLETKVKIINLPQRCTVRIFTLDGRYVRTFVKDSPDPEIIWDLKNENGVPIASGIYIIHVDAGELGEKVVKFMAIMPSTDITIY